MSWVCEFSEDAEKDLRVLPKAIQKRVERVMTHMATDPFQGDVKALHGEEWKGMFRDAWATTGSYSQQIAKKTQCTSCAYSCGPARRTDRRAHQRRL